MMAMLLPAPPVAAAPAAGAQDMQMAGSSGGHSTAVLPTPVTVVLLAALAVVLAVSLVRVARGKDPMSNRVDAGCEGLMTVAMGYMLLSIG